MAANTEIDVVIVNWNAGRMIIDCVSALDTIAPALPAIRLIVVDNASVDGSADGLSARNFPVSVIRNRENRGFAGGCNQAAAAGTSPFILFLNPDVVVSSPEAVLAPLQFLKDPANAGYGPCGIQLRNEKGEVARTLSPFPTPRRALGWMTGMDRIFPHLFDPHFLPQENHMRSRDADSIMGAFLLVKRGLFESLGGFSTSFFVYYEDVDFCRRAKNAGFQSWYMAQVSAMHEGCGTTRDIKATRYFYSTRSRIIYGLRHFSRPAGVAVALGWLTVDPLVRLIFATVTLSAASFSQTLAGARMLWGDAGNFMREPRLGKRPVVGAT